MEIAGLVAGIVGAIAGVAAAIYAVVAVRVAKNLARTQEEQQRESAKKQQILSITQELSSHLTAWYDALRAAVRNDDLQKLKDVKESIDSFKAAQIQLADFQGNDKYEGPLGPLLAQLDLFPECGEAVEAVRNFQKTALDFKGDMYGEYGSWISTLFDMVKGDGHWEETRRTAPLEYESQKEQGLSKVREAYRDAMAELQKVTITQLGSFQR